MGIDWDEFVATHAPDVFRIAWRILGQAEDAEDVTQEVFLEVHTVRHVDPVRNWTAFLKRIAVCRALDRLRQRKVTLEVTEFLAHDRSGPEAEVIGRELEIRLREAICQLSDREAEVFSLRYFDQLTHQQIAEALDTTTNAVATALHKARQKLESLLTEVPRRK